MHRGCLHWTAKQIAAHPDDATNAPVLEFSDSGEVSIVAGKCLSFETLETWMNKVEVTDDDPSHPPVLLSVKVQLIDKNDPPAIANGHADGSTPWRVSQHMAGSCSMMTMMMHASSESPGKVVGVVQVDDEDSVNSATSYNWGSLHFSITKEEVCSSALQQRECHILIGIAIDLYRQRSRRNMGY